MAFQLLSDREKTYLFPTEFNTLIAAAEGILANWLTVVGFIACTVSCFNSLSQSSESTVQNGYCVVELRFMVRSQ